MRSVLVSLSAVLLFAACASQPKTPQENADAVAVMGMMMMASAAQQKGSAASALWQVRIPPSAIEVITRIQAHRRTSGTWPQREDIALPEGVTELLLHGTEEDLAVVLKKGDLVAARFTILKDGTVVAAPLFEDLVSGLRSQTGSSVPFVPVLPPSKK